MEHRSWFALDFQALIEMHLLIGAALEKRWSCLRRNQPPILYSCIEGEMEKSLLSRDVISAPNQDSGDTGDVANDGRTAMDAWKGLLLCAPSTCFACEWSRFDSPFLHLKEESMQ